MQNINIYFLIYMMLIISGAIKKLFASEQLILGPAEKKDFNFDSFKSAWEDFEKSRT